MRGKKFMVLFGILLIILGIVLVFFNIEYSKTKVEFNDIATELKSKVEYSTDVIKEEDIQHLPEVVQKFFRYSGFIGMKKVSYMKASFKNVSFSLDRNKPNVKINYTQYNFVDNSNRLAFIETSMFGVPFQGLDAFVYGKGSMKGVICKLFTIFDQRGESMNRASLVTYLAECLWIPSAALKENIKWEEIDDLHVKATINEYGIEVDGIFEFNQIGEAVSFYTTEREMVTMNGTVEKVPWIAKMSNYVEHNGFKHPTNLQAIWKYENDDYIYFNSDNMTIEYDK